MNVPVRVLALLFFLSPVAFGAGAPPQTDYRRTPERFDLSVRAFTFDRSAVSVKLEDTERLPGASGEAKLERKNGVTEVEIELDEMKPAWAFGGDFNTYLLWAISVEGHVDNLGEFVLDGNRAKLDVSTSLDEFGLIVTAEPHFMVRNPGPFVVLGSVSVSKELRPPEQVELEIVSSHPAYRYERESLAGVAEAGSKVRSALRQAQVAVQLAGRARAGMLAPEAYEAARDSLLMAEGAAETRSPTDDDVERMARRTVRLASVAEREAGSRALVPEQEAQVR
jgi:hypothetical protein